ncbi:MAG: WbqC family protein [Methylococcales bacterium]|nr:WbqC family protein [Methylococcales bacterium]
MQPYLFPYIGYFQLLSACDLFIVYDDVQYIQGGWVNRNRILINGQAQWITLPVAKADYRLPINQRCYQPENRLAQGLRRRIIGAYATAPYFDKVMPLIDEILAYEDVNVARFNTHQLLKIADFIDINTPMIMSSAIGKPPGLSGQERVIAICKASKADRYINPIGGVGLYRPERFRESGLDLKFIKSTVSGYRQFGDSPIGSLSIIDVMMFNDPASINAMLSQYQLLENPMENRAMPDSGLIRMTEH